MGTSVLILSLSLLAAMPAAGAERVDADVKLGGFKIAAPVVRGPLVAGVVPKDQALVEP